MSKTRKTRKIKHDAAYREARAFVLSHKDVFAPTVTEVEIERAIKQVAKALRAN